MTTLPEWMRMRPPRAEGWFADDLDHLPEAPRHTELIDGALVFRVSPQRWLPFDPDRTWFTPAGAVPDRARPERAGSTPSPLILAPGR